MSLIDQELQKHKTFLITKSHCPHCVNAKDLLTKKGKEFHEIDYSEGKELIAEVIEKKAHKSFPMIFLDGEFIGGFAQLRKYYDKAENKSNV